MAFEILQLQIPHTRQAFYPMVESRTALTYLVQADTLSQIVAVHHLVVTSYNTFQSVRWRSLTRIINHLWIIKRRCSLFQLLVNHHMNVTPILRALPLT